MFFYEDGDHLSSTFRCPKFHPHPFTHLFCVPYRQVMPSLRDALDSGEGKAVFSEQNALHSGFIGTSWAAAQLLHYKHKIEFQFYIAVLHIYIYGHRRNLLRMKSFSPHSNALCKKKTNKYIGLHQTWSFPKNLRSWSYFLELSSVSSVSYLWQWSKFFCQDN